MNETYDGDVAEKVFEYCKFWTDEHMEVMGKPIEYRVFLRIYLYGPWGKVDPVYLMKAVNRLMEEGKMTL